MNLKNRERNLVVDGMDEYGAFAGDGNEAPFVIFDVEQQQNIAGPFESRELAEAQRLSILAGEPAKLNTVALHQALAERDSNHDEVEALYAVDLGYGETGSDENHFLGSWKGVARSEANAMKMSNCIEQPPASQVKSVEPKNVSGQVAVKPFYIWANEDCANMSDSFKDAKAIRLALFNDGGESVHIVDADGVEVVDAEIEAHEALVNAGYYAGVRKPGVKPEFPGAFMVNDPLDPNGYAIVGDDIAALILGARDHLIESASQREMSNANTQAVVAIQKYRVLGAHPNRKFFDIGVEARNGLHAFGVAALLLKEAGEEGDAEFFAAIPAGTSFVLSGDGVVTLGTVLDPEQASVFGLENPEIGDNSPTPGM